jgi:hypothetical protein
MITVQKTRKNILNSFNHLPCNGDRIMVTDGVSVSVNKCLETVVGRFEHYVYLSVLWSSGAQRRFDRPVYLPV